MNVDFMTIFLFLIFPLCAEIFIAFVYQDLMEWHRMSIEEKLLFGCIFPLITFPVLILPTIAFVALFGTLFESLYY